MFRDSLNRKNVVIDFQFFVKLSISDGSFSSWKIIYKWKFLLFRAQLEKERGKNKMLVQRLKQGNSEDIIWQTGKQEFSFFSKIILDRLLFRPYACWTKLCLGNKHVG